MNDIIKISGKDIKVSHPDKIWFPKEKITKLEIVEYYKEIAPIMVPYMKNRAVTMLRFPDGINGESFYHKDTPDYFPSWIKRKAVPKEAGGVVHYVVCQNGATLVYIANQACITPNLWLSRIDKINYPDRMIFDLDPYDDDFDSVRDTAFDIKKILEDLGLHPFVMTTGSRGVHVVVPLKRTNTFGEVRDFAHDVAQYLVNKSPKELTIEMSKKKRGKRLFIDTLRNGFGATGVSPYAVRAHPGAPVATPVEWNEIKPTKFDSQQYNYKTVFARLKKHGDAWKGIDKHAQSLAQAKKKLLLLTK